MSSYTVSLIQKSLLMIIILVLTFDAADSRQRIKALEAGPGSSEQIKELSSRLEAAEAKAKHAVEMAEVAVRMSEFADKQSFEAKQWVVDEMKKRNAEAEKQSPPSGYTYKQFMGGK